MRIAVAFALVCVVPQGAHADSFGSEGIPWRGRYRFILVGASMTEPAGNQNGVKCLEPSATTNVSTDEVTPRAKLVSATLFLSGSLLDDGPDSGSPPTSIFTPPTPMQFPDDVDALAALAVQEADRTAMLKPPGSAASVPVIGSINEVNVTGFYQQDPISSESGNVAFFVSRIDVTDVINTTGRGFIDGDYTVSGLRADVCYGMEATCDALPPQDDCASVSALHTKGNASFALLLIIEDPTFPLVSISTYEGLHDVLGPASSPAAAPRIPDIVIPDGRISDPAFGSLAFYVLEGDLTKGELVPGQLPCGAREYIVVDGDTNPEADGTCLTDADNPQGNLFNSTINTQTYPAGSGPPTCATPTAPHKCCDATSSNICGATGVDIDRFDISPALAPGANRIRVQYDTGQDRIALAAVVLSVAIFEPILDIDTQVRVPTAVDGYIQLGTLFEYSIAISNTGNAPATNVKLWLSAPRFTKDFELIAFPAAMGAVDLSQPAGGLNGTGQVRVEGFTVPPGEVAESRLRLRTTCPGLGRSLATDAEIDFAEGALFAIPAPTLIPAGPGVGECEGDDPNGPFAINPPMQRVLRGGGAPGCTAVGGGTLGAVFALLLLLGIGRRRGAWRIVAMVAIGGGMLGACGNRHQDPAGDTGPLPREITNLAGLPGTLCGSQLMVELSRQGGPPFCIDRFEASIDSGALGDRHQGLSDDDMQTNGSTAAKAGVALGTAPATDISWYQAKSACINAGKRLCSLAEWERACRGPSDYVFPYGDDNDDRSCNGFFNYAEEQPSATGSLETCGNVFGAYDMSGNVEEWVDAAIDRIPGQTGPANDRVIRGGSFRSNRSGLACFGAEFHVPPDTVSADRGFRCCADGPVN